MCVCGEKHWSAIEIPHGNGLGRELVNLMHTAQVTRIIENCPSWTNNIVYQVLMNAELQMFVKTV